MKLEQALTLSCDECGKERTFAEGKKYRLNYKNGRSENRTLTWRYGMPLRTCLEMLLGSGWVLSTFRDVDSAYTIYGQWTLPERIHRKTLTLVCPSCVSSGWRPPYSQSARREFERIRLAHAEQSSDESVSDVKAELLALRVEVRKLRQAVES